MCGWVGGPEAEAEEDRRRVGDRHRHRSTDGWFNGAEPASQTGRQTDGWTDGQTDRQTHRHTDRQTDRQTMKRHDKSTTLLVATYVWNYWP